MRALIREWISRLLDDKVLVIEGRILPLVLRLSLSSVVVADVANVLIHLVLDFFGLLPYPLWQALMIGCGAASVIAFPVTWLLSYHLAKAIRELAISRSEFERLSSTDELSGLKNRRAFFTSFERIRSDAVFVLIDIDRFKAINDAYGHIVGDEVIQSIGRVLAAIPATDVLETGRLGGEEFSLLIRTRPLDRHLQVVERIRVAVAAMAVGPLPYPVTLSAGIADISPERGTADIYRAADAALYLAKAAGRDRIVHERDIERLRPFKTASTAHLQHSA